MSSNYKIGNYTIETQNYYNALVNAGITDGDSLSQLDVNGDNKLSEDELAQVDISETDDDDNTEASVEQQVQKVEEQYEKQLINLYEELDSLEKQRLKYYDKAGSADSESLDGIIANASSITDQIKSTRSEIANTLVKKEAAVENIYLSAQSASDSTSSESAGSSASISGTSSTGSVAEMMTKVSKFQQGVLVDEADFIEETCSKYGVDPALTLSIIALETGYGTSDGIVYQNNPGGYMDSSTNYMTLKTFSTLEEGIEAVIKNLANGYINQGLTTISEIGAKYCPVGATNDTNGTNSGWVPSVTSIYNTLTGKNITSSTQLA